MPIADKSTRGADNSAEALPAKSPRSAPRARRSSQRTLVLAAVVVLVFIVQLRHEAFLSVPILTVLTPVAAVMILASYGQALIVGTGGFDISIPFTMTLVGAILLKETNGSNSDLAKAIVIALIACVVIGLVNGLLVEVSGLPSFIVTLATGQLIFGITVWYQGPIQNVANVPPALTTWSQANIQGVSWGLIVAIALGGVAALLLGYIAVGRRFVASSVAPIAAHQSGIRAIVYRVGAYGIAGIFYGMAAIFLAGQIKTPTLNFGEPYLLATAVAVVLGGASLAGGKVDLVATAMGALFLIVLNYGLSVEGYSPGFQQILQGIVLVIGLGLVQFGRGGLASKPGG